MKNSLSEQISTLKLMSGIHNDASLKRLFSDIDKYFDDEKTKSYLLGHALRKNKVDDFYKSDHYKKFVEYLKQARLERYFNGSSELPPLQKDEIRNWAIFVFSVLLIVLGVIRLLANFVDVRLSKMYNAPIVLEGGFPLIMGVLLLIVAINRSRQTRRRKRLIFKLTQP